MASPAKKPKADATLSIAEAFAVSRAEKRAAFIPYITAGFPALDSTVPLLLALQRGGADVIELGMPFSDPMADGPTIQKSSYDALVNGVKLDHCFDYVAAARAQGLTVPVVLMCYTNPFLSYGEDKLAARAKLVGVEGFIVVDMPPDDAGAFATCLEARGLAFIPLVAPTSADARMAALAKLAKGYVYCVSLTGVTGSRSELPADLPVFLKRVRASFGTDFPIVVGFGLSTPAHVAHVHAMGADGAVVGSKVIEELRRHATLPEQEKGLEAYTRHMRGGGAAAS